MVGAWLRYRRRLQHLPLSLKPLGKNKKKEKGRAREGDGKKETAARKKQRIVYESTIASRG
ncbi:unnamed protein product [Ilex paraguariensis]|uniref:Uncharacterized protein n=1 Tax=Ilex paraguariensis TaxID=185542 RepID=A0ABC8RS07_9AQUA